MMFARLSYTFVTLITCTAVANAALNFGGGKWIWSSTAVAGTLVNLPVGNRAFRKHIITDSLKTATTVEVIAIVDEVFTLWVNGVKIGTGKWATPEYFCTHVSGGGGFNGYYDNRMVVGITGGNSVASTPAGVLATVRVNYADGSFDRFVTDKSWLSSLTVPIGYPAVNFNDSTWTPAVEQVAYEDGYARFIPVPPANQVCQ